MPALRRAIERRFGLDPASIPGFDDRIQAAIADLMGEVGETAALLESPSTLDALMQRIRVGETRFFRDPEQLEAIATEVLPEAAAAGAVSILSAGCSTGEEAWTLSMILERVRGGRASAGDRVLGIDLGKDAIASARRAAYPKSTRDALAKPYSSMLVEEAGAAAMVTPHPRLRSRVRFVQGDLRTIELHGPHQLVFCRNVLIYLAPDTARAILTRLAESLAPDGVLVVSRGEGPRAREIGLCPWVLADGAVTVFQRPDAPPPSRGMRERIVIDEAATASSVARQAALAMARRPIQLLIVRRAVASGEVEAELRRLRVAATALGLAVVEEDAR